MICNIILQILKSQTEKLHDPFFYFPNFSETVLILNNAVIIHVAPLIKSC